jgi:hypothetical protein
MSLTAKQKDLLIQIVTATASEPGFMFAPNDKNLKALADAAMVEVNEATKNEAGHVAVRATAIAMTPVEPVAEVAEVNEPAEPATPSNGFKIVSTVPVPTDIRTRGKSSTYPFDKLEVSQSFFIPGEDAAKKFASTVSSATARFAVPDPTGKTREKKSLAKYSGDVIDPESGMILHKAGEPVLDENGAKTYNVETVPATINTREFVIRSVDDGAPWGHPGVAGAGVWRKS